LNFRLEVFGADNVRRATLDFEEVIIAGVDVWQVFESKESKARWPSLATSFQDVHVRMDSSASDLVSAIRADLGVSDSSVF
jgi:hypothetical protein